MPEVKIWSSEKRKPYNEFTIDFCKKEAIKIFTERLNNILNQFKEQ
jgi:hypothetical protein